VKKKICCIIVLFIFGALITINSYADSPLKKLGRGAANIVTSPFEIPCRIGEANNEDGPFAAFTYGILNGIFRMGLRIVVGAYEIVTFPIPFPKDYGPVITDPEFFVMEPFY